MEYNLNLGCNEWNIPSTDKEEWVNVDIDSNDKIHPDIIADATNLPFADNTFDQVYAGHLFEHFSNDEDVLKEWVRVLKPNGKITIVVPDTLKGFYQYKNGQISLEWLNQIIYGANDRLRQEHHQTFNGDILVMKMRDHLRNVTIVDTSPYLVANVFWQTIAVGFK